MPGSWTIPSSTAMTGSVSCPAITGPRSCRRAARAVLCTATYRTRRRWRRSRDRLKTWSKHKQRSCSIRKTVRLHTAVTSNFIMPKTIPYVGCQIAPTPNKPHIYAMHIKNTTHNLTLRLLRGQNCNGQKRGGSLFLWSSSIRNSIEQIRRNMSAILGVTYQCAIAAITILVRYQWQDWFRDLTTISIVASFCRSNDGFRCRIGVWRSYQNRSC